MDDPKIAGDPRKARTIAQLRAAVMELMAAPGRVDLPVSELVKHAGVSRATFYLHYSDVESVLNDALEAELMAISRQAEGFQTEGNQLNSAAPAQLIMEFFRHVDRNLRIYRWVFSADGSALIQANLLKGFIDIAAEGAQQYPKRHSEEAMRVSRTAAFFGGAIFGVLFEWLNSSEPGEPEDVAAWLWRRFVDFDRIATADIR